LNDIAEDGHVRRLSCPEDYARSSTSVEQLEDEAESRSRERLRNAWRGAGKGVCANGWDTLEAPKFFAAMTLSQTWRIRNPPGKFSDPPRLPALIDATKPSKYRKFDFEAKAGSLNRHQIDSSYRYWRARYRLLRSIQKPNFIQSAEKK
jgi:hypothetical protein